MNDQRLAADFVRLALSRLPARERLHWNNIFGSIARKLGVILMPNKHGQLSPDEREAKARDAARRQQLVAALIALPEWERQAFLLRRFDDLSSARIAECTGRSVVEVDKAIAHAIETTAGLLGEWDV